MRREEEERRERFEAGATALYNQARDIALATYDGDAAAEAVLALAQSIHGTNLAKVAQFMSSEAGALYEYGRDRGSNVHLVAAIALRRELATAAASTNDQGAAHNNLGNALATLGERESRIAQLEKAVAAYRAALEEYAREQVPLDWAVTENNLGNALATLGERESGTARLEEEVAAYRVALAERTRERVPLEWAMTQNNLGTALRRSGSGRAGRRGSRRRYGLPCGAGGTDARAGSARVGDDAEQSRLLRFKRSGGGRAGRRGSRRRFGLSCGARGADARAGSARLGGDAEQSRRCALDSRRAGERDGAARGGGYRPIAQRSRNELGARVLSCGRRRKINSAMRLRSSGGGRTERRGSRRRFRPIAQRSRNGRASAFRSTGR